MVSQAQGSGNALLGRWRDRLAEAATSTRLILPEGEDPRVRQAASELVALGLTPLLVVESDRDAEPVAGVETTTVTRLAAGPAGDRVREVAAQRGWPDEAVAEGLASRLSLAAAAVSAGVVDACVAGSVHPSGDVIRAAIRMIGLEPGCSLLSSSFLMLMPDGAALSFGDCAVVPEPDETELADIAVACARTFTTLTGEEPAVAMLSFSTKGSADHASARLVRAATELVRARSPQLAVDGELQFDAAVVESVARQKAAGSAVAGRANVFIFPNLAAGNIGYKIAERLGGAQAFGPIIQGLRAPMNDLSRGCDVSDIVNVSLISALQARSRPGEPHDPA